MECNVPEKAGDDQSKLVLVVDDDNTTRALLSAMLKKLGFRSLCIEDAEYLIFSCEYFQNIALILMDMNMPKMNGYTATRKIRKLFDKKKSFERIPIFAITIDPDKDKSLTAGCDRYLKKPVNMQDLASAMKEFGLSSDALDLFPQN